MRVPQTGEVRSGGGWVRCGDSYLARSADGAVALVFTLRPDRGRVLRAAAEGSEESGRRILELLSRAGIREGRVAFARQVHGTRILEAPSDPGGAGGRKGSEEGFVRIGEGDAILLRSPFRDGLVNQVPRRPFTAGCIFTADCFPVVMACDGRVVLCHAGWRGVAAALVPRALRLLAGGRHAARVEAWIGAGIGACCFEVGEEVASLFSGRFGPRFVARRNGRWYVDLRGCIIRQMEEEGVRAGAVHHLELCTSCGYDGDTFSWRRSGGRQEGHHLTFAGFVDGHKT